MLKNKKPNELVELEERYTMLSEMVPKVRLEIELAENFFNNVEPTFVGGDKNSSYIDVAILNLSAAEKKYELLLKELKILYKKMFYFNSTSA